MPVDGEVTILVDGTAIAAPVAVTAGTLGNLAAVDSALNALPAGSHSIEAQFSPVSPSGVSYGWSPSASAPATLNVSGLAR